MITKFNHVLSDGEEKKGFVMVLHECAFDEELSKHSK